MIDVTILTAKKYLEPEIITSYEKNILTEDGLIKNALEKEGLRVVRTNWDNPDYDWSNTRHVLFRTTWDYFHRFDEFEKWLEEIRPLTNLINPYELIMWNIDKHYLLDLQQAGISIPNTLFIEAGTNISLAKALQLSGWKDIVLKPAIAGGARHTYKINEASVQQHEKIFRDLVSTESMLIQEFQHNIYDKGEIAMMLFGGKFSHAILKKARPGDFRVQDDFGGTVHNYKACREEIEYAEYVVSKCKILPAYARVDIIWDNQMQPCISELELIEPELWFRKKHESAAQLAKVISAFC